MPIDLIPEDDAPQPSGESSFASSFADSIVENETTSDKHIFTDEGSIFNIPDAPEEVKERKKKSLKMSKQMRKSMDKIRNIGGDAIVTWFDQQAEKQPEWALSDNEREWLKDSMETVFEVLDIDLMIEPIGLQLTSIWWVIAYPFATFAFLFFSKKAKVPKPEDTSAT